ncbi:MAG: hypothetical protein ACKVPX_11855 [Myxococcaceae bacterium]
MVALLFQLTLSKRLPTDVDYQAVGDFLSREAHPGDVLLLHPWWTDRARLFVPAHLPVVGHLGSDSAALQTHPRIWLLSQPRLPRAGTGALKKVFLPARVPLGGPRSFGNLSLSLFKNGRAQEPPPSFRPTSPL